MKKALKIIFKILLVLLTVSLLSYIVYANKDNISTKVRIMKSNHENKKHTVKLKTGDKIQAGSADIDSNGGQIISDSLKGFVIDVPAGAYQNSIHFDVSYMEIKKSKGNKSFNPISPLITVENGGVFSGSPLTVTVPVKVPEGYFAMGFYYDEETSKLEGIPTVEVNKDYVKLSTCHFSNIVISADKIENIISGTADSGFTPGRDDWEFVNYGSYIAPDGHCAGQSISSMWYYSEKYLKGGPQLWGLSDIYYTPECWADDVYGYRFASVIQEEIDWVTAAHLFFSLASKIDDSVTYNSLKYSIEVTGQPQYIGVRGLNKKYEDVGHALVVYKVENGRIFVADPNYPGSSDRYIEYENGEMKPYSSGINANEILNNNDIEFNQFKYIAKTALINWEKINENWAKYEGRTIGNEYFPDYHLTIKDDAGKVFNIDSPIITESKNLYIEVSYVKDTPNYTKLYKFDNGKFESIENNTINIEGYKGRYGIIITGRNNQNGSNSWIGFEWLNIGELDINSDKVYEITDFLEDEILNKIGIPSDIAITEGFIRKGKVVTGDYMNIWKSPEKKVWAVVIGTVQNDGFELGVAAHEGDHAIIILQGIPRNTIIPGMNFVNIPWFKLPFDMEKFYNDSRDKAVKDILGQEYNIEQR